MFELLALTAIALLAFAVLALVVIDHRLSTIKKILTKIADK